jgi:hypothetical protein
MHPIQDRQPLHAPEGAHQHTCTAAPTAGKPVLNVEYEWGAPGQYCAAAKQQGISHIKKALELGKAPRIQCA